MPSMPTGLNISSNEEEFEILCLKLLRLRWKRPRIQQHGKRGERQNGVDLLDTSGETPLVAANASATSPTKPFPHRRSKTRLHRQLHSSRFES